MKGERRGVFAVRYTHATQDTILHIIKLYPLYAEQLGLQHYQVDLPYQC